MRVFVNPRGKKVTLALHLPMETYLLGVVPEIGSLGGDLLEAGRAQAIRGASYTLYYSGRHRSTEASISTVRFGTRSTGRSSERPLATGASPARRGNRCRQPSIRANYCSTCGGITDVWEAWPKPPFSYRQPTGRDGGADHCVQSPHYRFRRGNGRQRVSQISDLWADAGAFGCHPASLATLLDVGPRAARVQGACGC